MLAILAVIALATVGVWAVDGGDEIEEPAYEEIVALSAVEPMMNYQGRLLDSSGNPVNGNVNLIFRLYDIPTGGIELWSESKTVQVVNGLLNTDLSNLDVEDFDQALWLEIEVEGETISPRQQLLGAPYAFSLVPGARVDGSVNVPALTLINEGASSLSDGLRVNSANGWGVWSTAPDGHAVYAESINGTGVYAYSGEGDGVRAYSYGSDSSDDGVYAYSSHGHGVYAYSNDNIGVYGKSNNDYGGYFEGDYGVYGDGIYGVWGSGSSYGVYGRGYYNGGYFVGDEGDGVRAYSYGSDSMDDGVYGYSNEGRGVYGGSYNNTGVYGYSTNSHGVYGKAPSWGGYGGYFDGWSGVYGEGDYYGVVGIGDYYEGGYFTSDQDNAIFARSYGSGTTDDGVTAYSSYGRGVYARSSYGIGVEGYGGSGSGDYGGYFTGWRGLYAKNTVSAYAAYFDGNIYVNGDIYKSGTCNFVMDHPTDPTKEIVYVCLEGGEAGTYTRGSAQLENGVATVKLPEDFRLVTSPEGITVQVTPTGDCKGLYVSKKSNSEIVVAELGNGKSDATFDYLVNGIRIGYEDYQPIRDKDPERRDPGVAAERIAEEENPLISPEPSPVVREPAPEEPEEPAPEPVLPPEGPARE